jgi:hypothetical protein
MAVAPHQLLNNSINSFAPILLQQTIATALVVGVLLLTSLSMGIDIMPYRRLNHLFLLGAYPAKQAYLDICVMIPNTT